MGVYIKGMDMPKCDIDCPIFTEEICPVESVLALSKMKEERPPDCPLVPVPTPHGRCIDADALTEKLKKHREYHSDGSNSGAAISNGIGQCLDIINGRECPTIIEAEEEMK